MNKFVILIFLFSLIAPLYPDSETFFDEVQWPMELRLPISGSFAEFRNHSMHLGCDYKTYLINGLYVHSVFSGSIDSIRYTEYGYGLSMNIYNSNQKLYTKYAHLNDFKGDVPGLEELRLALLLMGRKDGFSVQFKSGYFSVKSNTKIARSGETGSGVSHLHLEVFNSSYYFNPLTFKQYKQEDITHPIIQTVYIDADSKVSYRLPVQKLTDSIYAIDEREKIYLNGKIRFKIAGYDLMTSRNKNGVFGLKLLIDDQTVFERQLDKSSYKDSYNRQKLYDINRSSLKPAHYVYNLFDNLNNKSSSIDLTNRENGQKIIATLVLRDASGNESIVKIPFEIDNSFKQEKKHPKVNFYYSQDKKVKLNFSPTEQFGDGFVQITKVDKLPDGILPANMIQASEAYNIQASNITWKGNASGTFESSILPKDETLYIYDEDIKEWINLKCKKSKNICSFHLSRLGILTVLKDKSSPRIAYPYLIYRDYNLPDIRTPKTIERFYSISDVGTGIKKIELLLEGKPYPFVFDSDRSYIKVEIPESFKKEKSIFTIQIRALDWSGNYSDWFVELLTL